MRTLLLALAGAAAAMATLPASAAPTKGSWGTEMATPPGVTLQYLTNPRTRAGFFVQGIAARGRTVGYANGAGKSLYTLEKEPASGWEPALVPEGAKSSSLWTIVTRPDGAKQWAFRGKALYACATDNEIGQAKCSGKDGARTAIYEPGEGMAVPPGVQVDTVPIAGGDALVTPTGMTLYYQADPAKAKKSAANLWKPVSAPALAAPIGEFSIVRGSDGTRQWAFRGRPLFSYAQDIELSDAYGNEVPGWQAAVVFTSFMPQKTSVGRPLGHSDVVVDGRGMTLYKRDVSYQIVTGHGLPRSVPTIPAIGRQLGTQGCDAACQKIWPPFEAARDAQPSGFWQISELPNGKRQWVYQGYHIYGYTRDQKPGDVTGDQIYDVMVNDGSQPDIADVAPTTNGWALYWAYLEPN